ncbi:PerC family transcriptional regulator [Citrobacter amalonaticus]|uniref:PerC family transcriptional regulator n=1 Tax=Citrobacter amalonaticus TaxID=35703 RepID=UPI00339BF6C5
MNKPKLTKLQKYHLDHVSKSEVSKVIAVTPAAMEIEKRAIAREKKGHFRVAARLWLLCMDAAKGEVERHKIAVRRDQCITKSNGLRCGDYSGIMSRGVIYD